MMKNLFTFFFILISINILAAIRFVDPNLSSGNGTTHFNSVASAVAASQDGDEIVLTAGTYNENTLAISTSIKLYPQNVGDVVTFNFDINISGKTGLSIELFDLNFDNLSTTNSSSSWSSNRPRVYLVECIVSNTIDCSNHYWDLYCFQSSAAIINFVSGAIVKCTSTNLNLYQDNVNQDGRNKIIANTISGRTFINNTNRLLLLANNSIYQLFYKGWRTHDSNDFNLSNLIVNNNFVSGGLFDIASDGVSYHNTKVCNNSNSGTINFRSGLNASYYDGYCHANSDNYGTNNYCSSSYNWSTTSIAMGGGDGFFEWSYNTFNPTNFPTGSSGYVMEFVQGTSGSDTGNPSHFFYDIDMTRNDVGTGGGPYSTSNYPTSSGSAKAYIYYLDMPTDLFPNDNIQINAEGYHKN